MDNFTVSDRLRYNTSEMQTPDATNELLSGFECLNVQAVTEKIGRFATAGLASTHLLLDFDRTMTVSASGDDDATTWQILQRHLPPEGQVEYQDFYKKHRQLEIQGLLTESDAEVWFQGVLGLYVKYGVNLKNVETDFLSVVALRPGMKELLQLCYGQKIPAAILSAGIKDVIEILLAHYGVQADPIVSTKLITDETGIITGWQKDSLVHVLNKREAGHAELEQVRLHRPYCLLIGDSMDDAAMTGGDDNVLRIRVLDPRQDEATDRVAQLKQTFQKFDLVITSGDVMGVTALLGRIAAAVPASSL